MEYLLAFNLSPLSELQNSTRHCEKIVLKVFLSAKVCLCMYLPASDVCSHSASPVCRSESFFPRSCKVARWWLEETRRGKVPRGCWWGSLLTLTTRRIRRSRFRGLRARDFRHAFCFSSNFEHHKMLATNESQKVFEFVFSRTIETFFSSQ